MNSFDVIEGSALNAPDELEDMFCISTWSKEDGRLFDKAYNCRVIWYNPSSMSQARKLSHSLLVLIYNVLTLPTGIGED